jgi:hypothetical protein
LESYVNSIFYAIKPLVPRSFQIALRRRIASRKRQKFAHVWPIDPASATPPTGWNGWPGGKQFALVLSHDVDTFKGYNNALKLADLEEGMGFRSQFNFVPERYGQVTAGLLNELKERKFGIGVHGLKHDGKLFSSRKIFEERAPRINSYLKAWDTRGFTTPSMIRKHEWMHDLKMDFCTSTFDTDPFEPQSAGAATIFPYWVQDGSTGCRFLELPYTLVQDFTLFVLLKEKDIGIWKEKIDWIVANKGMALLNSHPDYMNFNNKKIGPEEYPVRYYLEFLDYLNERYTGQFFHALPAEVFQDLTGQWANHGRSRNVPEEHLAPSR